MPKFPTFPTLYDEVLKLDITKLKRWGYLEPEQRKSGTVAWSIDGNEIGCISITVHTDTTEPFISLNYNFKDEPRAYAVNIVSIPSNLGKGVVWYFLCPKTLKKCRKLYSVGGYFLHREAHNYCMYESQTRSKKWREMERVYGSFFDSDNIYSEIHSKHFKQFYNGKPTKRYLRLLEKLERAEQFTADDIERLFLS